MSELDDDSIIVNEEWQKHTVGERVNVWLGDGTKKSLKIAAVMTIGTGDNGVHVTPRNAPAAPVDRVDVRLADGADAGTVAAGLRQAGACVGRGISLANTMVMATSDRVRELAVPRLAGATGWQVLRLVCAEALMVVMVGGLLGTLVAGFNLMGMWSTLGLLSVRTSIEVPWVTLAAALGACAVLAVSSAVAPAGLSLPRGLGTHHEVPTSAERPHTDVHALSVSPSGDRRCRGMYSLARDDRRRGAAYDQAGAGLVRPRPPSPRSGSGPFPGSPDGRPGRVRNACAG
ncbi:hypothetical protein AFM16_32910 [Streptomyces antibioticus]|uniref:ABC3 transporter permease C-terminal domain-containing protein n=1 Tax=Streptomyces antibioticus TaxID=1890 RepID=A0ABX3LAA2_STRAT|nr:hypothetical protein AFM16_32910 [Streptomyces antibioticus]